MHKQIKGKKFTWWHFSSLEEADFGVLEKEFKFHPLDFDDLRDETEIPKSDVYKYYVFSVFAVPKISDELSLVRRSNLAVFVGKDYVVTATRKPIDTVDRFFARAGRSSGLKRDALGHSPGYFVYKLLDYVFRDAKVVLRELVRETEQIESELYVAHTKTTTKRLGILRRNVLYLRHIIEPQRMLLEHYVHSKKAFIPKSTEMYFDDIRDTLDGISLVTENLKSIVDGLFDVNEAFLSHKTNQIIRILTIISVIFMPPMLISSYYGMNVSGLPFKDNLPLLTVIILLSFGSFLWFVIKLDRRN